MDMKNLTARIKSVKQSQKIESMYMAQNMHYLFVPKLYKNGAHAVCSSSQDYVLTQTHRDLIPVPFPEFWKLQVIF